MLILHFQSWLALQPSVFNVQELNWGSYLLALPLSNALLKCFNPKYLYLIRKCDFNILIVSNLNHLSLIVQSDILTWPHKKEPKQQDYMCEKGSFLFLSFTINLEDCWFACQNKQVKQDKGKISLICELSARLR